MTSPAKPKSPAVAQAIAILRRVAESQTALGVSAIARETGLGPSSCFNILKTLEAEAFVTFDPVAKTYALGGGAVALARRALDPENAFDLARPHVAALAHRFSATCALWRVADDRRLVLLGSETSGGTTRIHLEPGQRLPLLLGGAGRAVIAAEAPAPVALAAEFKTIRWAEPPTFEDYIEQLDATRRQGWAVDDGASLRGVVTVGSAVCDRGAPRLSVSVLFFSGYPAERIPDVGAATSACAAAIAGLLYAN